VPVARLTAGTPVGHARTGRALACEAAGVVAWFVDGRSTAIAEGGFDPDGGVKAERLSVDAMWNDEPRSYAIRFGDDGRLTEARFDPPIDVSEREPVPDALRFGPDPLSVVVAAARSLPDDAADRSITTYDGKRAMRFGWRCGDAPERIETDVYAGAVFECAVEGEQIGGFHRKYSSNNLQASRPARVWLAPVDGGRFYAPVKLMMDTQYGALVANMTRVGPPTPATD